MATPVKSVFIAAVMLSLPFMFKGEVPRVMQLIEQDSVITVVQPSALEARLVGKAEVSSMTDRIVEQPETVEQTPVVTGGYRVQVFADNNARTAKDEARSKAIAIREQLPHLATYVTYEAPYWRLRVGDFRSESDAEAAAAEIKHYFPNISREVRVVRDRINK